MLQQRPQICPDVATTPKTDTKEQVQYFWSSGGDGESVTAELAGLAELDRYHDTSAELSSSLPAGFHQSESELSAPEEEGGWRGMRTAARPQLCILTLVHHREKLHKIIRTKKS